MMPKCIAISFLICISVEVAKSDTFCTKNSDCERLGNLICIRSLCKWGICACERGTVSRYLGSLERFECVKLKRIGDFCSTDSTVGECGAPNSYCDDDVCTCKSGFIPRMKGEICLNETDVYASESASLSIGDNCITGHYNLLNTTYNLLESHKNLPPRCGCPRGYKTELINHLHISGFQGRKLPMCVPNRIDTEDVCISEIDCPGQSLCNTLNRCKCSHDSHVVDYERLKCGFPLPIDAVCTISRRPIIDKVCNGLQGLTCGDPCDERDKQVQHGEFVCVCGPSYARSGSTCVENIVGSACFGDFNCKGPTLSYNGICDNGSCQDNSLPIVSSFSLFILAFLLV